MNGEEKRRRARIAIGGLVVLAASILTGCRQEVAPAGAGASAATEPAPEAEALFEVETALVRRGSILQRIAAPGSLVAKRQSRIGPEVGGRIAEIFVEEGDRVAAGDPLFQIEREPYELALRQSRARLDSARAQRNQVSSDLARARELRRQKVVSENEIDKLTTSAEVAEAAVREAEEMVAIARRNLDQTRVRAPYAASVAARFEDEGTTALVQPQTVVVVLQETHELEAQATIPEIYFDAIRAGDSALLKVEGLAHPIATTVEAVSDAIDPVTRTFLVKMPVPNEQRRLKAGLFAEIEILPRAKSDVVLVPREAIRHEDGEAKVLAVREGRAVLLTVQLGVASEDAVEVLHGVRVDDEIVVGPHARTLGPGMRVAPKGAASRADDAASAGPAA